MGIYSIDDRLYMKMALALAEKGRGFTSPNPMVGAVVVKEGRVIGKGWHKAAGGPHAEVHALDEAGLKAEGATLYVTLEPCNHQGRTPPCTRKIIDAGISKVITAMEDPNPHVKGGGNACLKQHGIETKTGICEDEARSLNEIFIKHIQTGRPFVILKCAATLDGQLATKTGDSKWVTGETARHFVHRLRHQVDAIMVGIGTVNADNPSLTTRLDGFDGQDPIRIILDTRLTIDENAKVFNPDAGAKTIVVTSERFTREADAAYQRKKNALEKKGATVFSVVSEKKGWIDLTALMKQLGQLGITSVLIEGGGQVIASALADGVVDKAHLFYAPKLLGGNDGIPICMGPGPTRMQDSIRLQRTEMRRFGDDFMITGYF